MKTAYDYLSLIKITPSNIDFLIAEKQGYISVRLSDVLTDVNTAKNVGEELIELAALKEAKAIMSTPNYSAYEESGKVLRYEEFSATL